jgi:hypothetical protein
MVAAVPALMADTVTLYQAAYYYSDGGEFTAVTAPAVAELADYSSSTMGQGGYANSFQTFCVQVGTEFEPGVTYNFTLSSISLGGPGNGAPGVTLGQPYSYPLSEGTAWLYSQFARGTLANYDFSNASSDRTTDAGMLQSAIWALQGGQSDASFPNGVSGNVYYAEALAALGGNLTTAATAATDYGVEIMNLTSGPNSNNQNQLVLVPDGGSTVLMLGVGFGLLSLAGFRHRKLTV